MIGNKIPAIENLGVTRDQYDALDFTDNDIQILGNFPLLLRLKSLYMSNNRINKIESTSKNIPNLECLILCNNSFENFSDISPLNNFTSLRTLSMLGNPVSKKKNYRLYVINLLPSLYVLDFERVRDIERKEASRVFSSHVEEIIEQPSLSKDQILRIKQAIQKASSLDEIQSLERALSIGYIPEGLQ